MNLTSHPFEEGRVIGNYTIGRYLGGGSYGATYETHKGEKRAAIKFLKPNAEQGGDERFKHEIWALEQLDHPNLPKLLDHGTSDGGTYICMSLARGRPLSDIQRQHANDGGAMGEQRCLDILKDVFSALSYLHSLGIVHRDIKPNNIIVRESSAFSTVIDLGFCKAMSGQLSGDTFFNAGASRYSSPQKLHHPTRAIANDDIFAVGVVAYYILTNKYPWSVDPSADVGHLREEMESVIPDPPHEVNNLVSLEVSNFVMSLISRDDNARPSAEHAKNSVIHMRGIQRSSPKLSASHHLLATKVVRDPLHGDIRLTLFEWEVMNSKEFQRLRFIRQLGFANLVYPAADHTRFSHSLGTLFVTERILQSVEMSSGRSIGLEDRLLARIYALVHDVTHIPFGHTIEDELGVFDRHDENEERKSRLFFSESSEIGGILRKTEYGQIVLEHLEKDENTVQRKLHLKEFIDAPFGSDVIDYIDRDSYFCGLDHRVDSSIFRRYSLVDSRDEAHLAMRQFGNYGFRADAVYTVERILIERYSLFLKVYAHTMKFAAGAMLGKALRSVVGKKKTSLKQQDLEEFGDLELLLKLRAWKSASASNLAKRLLLRDLYKPVFIARVLGDDSLKLEKADQIRHNLGIERGYSTPEGRSEFERQLARKCGVNESDVIIFFPPTAPGIKKIEAWTESKPGKAKRSDYANNSEFGRLVEKHLALWRIYVFVAPELSIEKRRAIAEEAELMLGFTNERDLGQSANLRLGN